MCNCRAEVNHKMVVCPSPCCLHCGWLSLDEKGRCIKCQDSGPMEYQYDDNYQEGYE